ncbi:hypothetical protein IDH44_23390 [Paenibacillus sp. IB182496]|uniref:Uncharacterized protein n=1 Tax=Paenibacillus sabuli TaxID=2772509 RepID=A0A927BYB9_9BACL|nr:hypothetical protein [Paenibacillus sabuli]MBD2848151.1 hypothetical protein [Paenibacillus sabuli]
MKSELGRQDGGLVNRFTELEKLIKLTGDRAKLDAKANDTYIVYKTSEGQIVREYTNGDIIPIAKTKGAND